MEIIQGLLNTKMKEYMKSKQKVELSTVRMAISALKNQAIKIGTDLDEKEEINVLKKEIKSYNESLVFAIKNNDITLQNELKTSIKVLQAYLPEEMSEIDAKAIIVKLLADNQIEHIKQKGMAMKIIMPVLKGKIDGQIINKIVMEILK